MTALPTKAFRSPARDHGAGDDARLGAMIRYLQQVLAEPGGSTEKFHAIFLGEGRSYLGDTRMGSGRPGSLTLRMRELYARALAIGATAIILAHNHPSGICRPSQRDIEETHRLAEIGKALDVELLDHLIITEHRAYSMRAGGDL